MTLVVRVSVTAREGCGLPWSAPPRGRGSQARGRSRSALALEGVAGRRNAGRLVDCVVRRSRLETTRKAPTVASVRDSSRARCIRDRGRERSRVPVPEGNHRCRVNVSRGSRSRSRSSKTRSREREPLVAFTLDESRGFLTARWTAAEASRIVATTVALALRDGLIGVAIASAALWRRSCDVRRRASRNREDRNPYWFRPFG